MASVVAESRPPLTRTTAEGFLVDSGGPLISKDHRSCAVTNRREAVSAPKQPKPSLSGSDTVFVPSIEGASGLAWWPPLLAWVVRHGLIISCRSFPSARHKASRPI